MEKRSLGKFEFVTFSVKKARKHLRQLKSSQRSQLCIDLHIGNGWAEVDQRHYQSQMITQIVRACCLPYQFLRTSILKDGCEKLFCQGKSTIMKYDRENFYWEGVGSRTINWIRRGAGKGGLLKRCFDSVVHFVQNENGTGVCISKRGRILTCAHVVSHGDDGEDEVIGNKRIGRKKLVMFPSGEVYFAKCVAVVESEKGDDDVAILDIVDSEGVGNFPYSEISNGKTPKKVFCVGNPSNIDLECSSEEDQELGVFPRVWHTSVGEIKGITKKNRFGKVMHTCWTYWGHSGAPLFDEKGKIVAIHNSWDQSNGMRHAVSLESIRRILK